MTRSTIDALLETLDAEADAIRSARYQPLKVIQTSIESQMAQLRPDQHPQQALQKLKSRLQANQALLQAAVGGMAAARARVAELLQVQQGLSIYDQSGTLATVPTHNKGLEKKA
ncbi:hypothetical protein [Loktanella sp. Alg231-35]|uniref:hypothetical protein n=1 Tax=Loktanella sp. Alg231-35 TaxID=1922220 RepID=UPI000D54DCFE|nr:hypothetical protein [Loktanella sp. Alg231-35]